MSNYTNKAVEVNINIARGESLQEQYQFIDEGFDSSSITNVLDYSSLPLAGSTVNPDNYVYVTTTVGSDKLGYYYDNGVSWEYMGAEKPIDLRNFTGSSQVRITSTDATSLAITVSFPIPQQGIFKLSLTAAQIETLTENVYVYDLLLTDNTAVTTTRKIYGKFNVIEAVTK